MLQCRNRNNIIARKMTSKCMGHYQPTVVRLVVPALYIFHLLLTVSTLDVCYFLFIARLLILFCECFCHCACQPDDSVLNTRTWLWKAVTIGTFLLLLHLKFNMTSV